MSRDWSNFRRIRIVGIADVDRKLGPVPFGSEVLAWRRGGQSHFRGEILGLYGNDHDAAKIGTVPCERFRFSLGNNLINNMSVHVRKASIDTVMAHRELFVIDAQQV